MEHILYNKLANSKNTSPTLPYAYILDYLTNRRYIKFNYFYTLIYIYNIIIKNNTYLLSYNYIKKMIKLKSFKSILKNFRYVKQSVKLSGVGYRLNLTKHAQIISLTIGYSHKIYIKFPESIFYTLSSDNTCIELSSFNYFLLTTIISQLKKLHKYDPYKGKGFKLVGEIFTPKFYKK